MTGSARPIVAVVYAGVRYPITNDVAQGIIYRIRSFDAVTHSDFYEFPTTDGRSVVLRIGPSLPIGFETEA